MIIRLFLYSIIFIWWLKYSFSLNDNYVNNRSLSVISTDKTFNNITYLFNISEYQALYDLYYSTKGDSWSFFDSNNRWNFSIPLSNEHSPCLDNWFGITCIDEHLPSNTILKNIYSISLQNMNLDGTLPSSMKHLSRLMHLTITLNRKLIGTLPFDEINHFPSLNLIAMERNGFTGTIPSNIFTYKALTLLSLHDNYFNGSLEHIRILPSLQYIDIRNNSITGTIPNLFFSNQCNLIDFDISHNLLHGEIPLSILHCHFMRKVLLNHNQFQELFPSYLLTLRSSITLSLGHNHFYGSIGNNNIKIQSKSLQSIDLSNNFFTGSYPTIFSSFQQLKNIQISHNLFHGSIVDNLSGHFDLRLFDVSYNSFTGSFPSFLKQLRHLEIIKLNHNEFTGLIPRLKQDILPFLREITMNHNYFTGNIYGFINYKHPLLFLSLHNNYLTGNIPIELFSLRQLRNLYLSNNFFTGSIRNHSNQTFKFHKTMFNLDLSQNYLTGSIPWTYITSQNNFISLSLANNCFRPSSLPTDLCQLTSLKNLILNGFSSGCSYFNYYFDRSTDSINNISGSNVNNFPSYSIPTCIYQIPSIQALYLSNSHYLGTLPSEINKELSIVSLAYNHLSGTIPKSWQEDERWQLLDLSNNHLSGHLQPVIVVKESSSWYLGHNRLSGTLPLIKIIHNNRISHQNNQNSHNLHLNMLQGNWFSCDYNRKDVSNIKDPKKEAYRCGSNDMNVTLMVWLLVVVSAGVMLGIGYVMQDLHDRYDYYISYSKFMSKIKNKLENYYFIGSNDNGYAVNRVAACGLEDTLPMFCYYVQTLLVFRRVLIYFIVIMVIVLAIFYVILGEWYSLYKDRYVYVWSSVYLSGDRSGEVLWITWMLMILMVSILTNAWLVEAKKHICEINEKEVKKQSVPQSSQVCIINNPQSIRLSTFLRIKWVFFYSLVYLWSFLITGSVALVVLGMSWVWNMGYLYVLNHGSSWMQWMYVVCLCLYKLWAVKRLIPDVINVLLIGWLLPESSMKVCVKKYELYMEIVMMVMVTMIIPCMTMVLYDDNCLYKILYDPILLKKDLPLHSCGFGFDGFTSANICDNYIYTISYVYLYSYSYQCSSHILINYGVVYGMIILLDTFVSLGYVIACGENINSVNIEDYSWRGWIVVLLFYVMIGLTFGVMFPMLLVMILLNVNILLNDQIDVSYKLMIRSLLLSYTSLAPENMNGNPIHDEESTHHRTSLSPNNNNNNHFPHQKNKFYPNDSSSYERIKAYDVYISDLFVIFVHSMNYLILPLAIIYSGSILYDILGGESKILSNLSFLSLSVDRYMYMVLVYMGLLLLVHGIIVLLSERYGISIVSMNKGLLVWLCKSWGILNKIRLTSLYDAEYELIPVKDISFDD